MTDLNLDGCRTRLDIARSYSRNVGERLHELRKQRGYSTRHLSEVSGVRIDVINRAEKGTVLLSTDDLQRLWAAVTGPYIERAPKPDE